MHNAARIAGVFFSPKPWQPYLTGTGWWKSLFRICRIRTIEIMNSTKKQIFIYKKSPWAEFCLTHCACRPCRVYLILRVNKLLNAVIVFPCMTSDSFVQDFWATQERGNIVSLFLDRSSVVQLSKCESSRRNAFCRWLDLCNRLYTSPTSKIILTFCTFIEEYWLFFIATLMW
jgi:hypothetical protein